MRWPTLYEGILVRRDNRFRATVVLQGEDVAAHVANSGRLGELLVPGGRVWLTAEDGAHRKTAFDLALVEYAGELVSVDARLPNVLLAEAIHAGRVLPGYTQVRREVVCGNSRFDLRLSGPKGVCWVEAKSCTLVQEGMALFPDAPTARGRKHLDELARCTEEGERAVVVFVVQRGEARVLAPHRRADPAFADALVQARCAGVEVLAYTCRITTEMMTLDRAIPVVEPG